MAEKGAVKFSNNNWRSIITNLAEHDSRRAAASQSLACSRTPVGDKRNTSAVRKR